MKERGLISNYLDYRRLPLGVLEDARLMQAGEIERDKRQEQQRRTTSRGRHG